MDFQSKKSFGKLRLRPFQPYIALGGMVGKVSVSAFQNFFWIENLLNIKKVMSKTFKASFYPFDMSNMSNN